MTQNSQIRKALRQLGAEIKAGLKDCASYFKSRRPNVRSFLKVFGLRLKRRVGSFLYSLGSRIAIFGAKIAGIEHEEEE